MRGPECLSSCETEGGGPCTKHLLRPQASASGLGAFTCMHVRSRGPASALAGVTGRHRRPKQACLVQGWPCQDNT
eukprot:127735-Chlamydomonas_euryale.AAC.3